MDNVIDQPGPGELAVREEHLGTGVVVTVLGELDISTVGELERTVDALLSKPPERLVFDLSELRFMDSSGIAVLLRANSKLDSVYLRNPSHVVARVIESTGLKPVLRLEP